MSNDNNSKQKNHSSITDTLLLEFTLKSVGSNSFAEWNMIILLCVYQISTMLENKC